MAKKGKCPACDGDKTIEENGERVPCPECSGTGWLEIYPEETTGGK